MFSSRQSGIPNHRELLPDLLDSGGSDHIYASIKSRPNSLTLTSTSYNDRSSPVGSNRVTLSVGTSFTNGAYSIDDADSNPSSGYLRVDHFSTGPVESPVSARTSKRRLLIGCLVVTVLFLLSGLAATTTLLLLPTVSEALENRDDVVASNVGNPDYTTHSPTEMPKITETPSSEGKSTTTVYSSTSASTSETAGITSPFNSESTHSTVTSSVMTTSINIASLSTVTTAPPTPPPTTTTVTSLPTTLSTTESSNSTSEYPSSSMNTTTTPFITTVVSTTLPETTTTSQETVETTQTTTCSGTRKCHSCTSVSDRCPANGTMAGTDHGQVMDCPCDIACFTEIRPWNGVHRGCTSDFPLLVNESRIDMSCRIIGEKRTCFCLGDRCNTHDMTDYPEYEGG